MDTAMVTINILDDNDHNPVFTELEYEFTLDWNEQKTVGQVKVSFFGGVCELSLHVNQISP